MEDIMKKKLLAPVLAASVLLGLGISQAKEWEQSLLVDAKSYLSQWGFSKDSLVEGFSENYSSWNVNESCVCGFMYGDCYYDIQHFSFFEYDQTFWNVVSGERLKAGVPLDLKDTSTFAEAKNRDGTSLTESYVYSTKNGAANDTNYFVYRKDSSYYALCQYITVYDSSRSGVGSPAYLAHQCIFQDDGTPTFSKIPAYSAELPKGRLVEPRSGAFNPIRRETKPRVTDKSYLVNGKSAKGQSAIGIRVEKERVYRH